MKTLTCPDHGIPLELAGVGMDSGTYLVRCAICEDGDLFELRSIINEREGSEC